MVEDIPHNIDNLNQYNMLWGYKYPVSTFMELDSLKKLGAHSVLIDAPLTHRLYEVEDYNFAEVRMVANVAYYAYIPRENGVVGSYIRPEDVETYAGYVDVIEFEDCDKKREQALYRIYMENHAWPGNLRTIITNLDYNGVNRMIPADFAEKRMNCGQRCLESGSCHLCYRYLDLANPELLKAYKKDT